MCESTVHSPLVVTKHQKGEIHWRAEEADAFSQVDFSQAEIRQALKCAYRVLLKYRARRLNERSEGR